VEIHPAGRGSEAALALVFAATVVLALVFALDGAGGGACPQPTATSSMAVTHVRPSRIGSEVRHVRGGL
jgi:hypothetical protein